MIPYVGMPITPAEAALHAVGGGHPFFSARYLDQLPLGLEICQSFAIDHGGFSAWKSGEPITDWKFYYDLIAELHRYPQFDFSVIPDVIDGTEAENDALLNEWPWRLTAPHVGAPVWHLNESLERLSRMVSEWPRICLGSSGEYSQIGTQKWWNRMAEAMDVICDKSGRPCAKIHGLRMLDPAIFTKFPFSSADSTNIARNIGIDSAWKGTYPVRTKGMRAAIMRERLEIHQSPTLYDRVPIQSQLFMAAHDEPPAI